MNDEGQRKVRKGIMIGAIACALMLVGFLGSYAFFIGQLGQNKNQEVTVETGTLELVFSDGNNGFNQELDFGESAEKTFTIENTGTKEGIISVSWMNLLNTYLEGSMTYTFLGSDTEDGEYTEIVSNKNVPKTTVAEDKVLASGITIPAGAKKYYKLIIQLNYTDFDQTADLQAKLETQFKMTEGILKDPTPVEKTLAKLGKTVKDGNPNFARPAVTDETADGLYAMADDYGTSYYYRGAVEDNYVKFGTWKSGANIGKDMYWRIIRVNGDGSLRIIYDGTSAHTNGEISTDRLALQTVAWNDINNDDAKYIGYMYGGNNGTPSTSKIQAQTNETNSNIKKEVESWYKNNLSDVDNEIADAIYCNDRSIPGKDITLWLTDTELGYNKNGTGYGALGRILTGNNSVSLSPKDPEPVLTCANLNDSFTKFENLKGNGNLEEKVGIVTADEVILAGSGSYNVINQNYFLNKGSSFWTLSPCGASTTVSVFHVNSSGSIYSTVSVKENGGVAPVISLSADAVSKLTGSGTMDSPFELIS